MFGYPDKGNAVRKLNWKVLSEIQYVYGKSMKGLKRLFIDLKYQAKRIFLRDGISNHNKILHPTGCGV